jgi:hypothetical protein
MSKNSNASSLNSAIGSFSLEKFATSMRADFRFSAQNVMLLVAVFAVGLVVHLTIHSSTPEAVGMFLGSALALSILLRLIQIWETVVVLGTADCLVAYLALGPDSAVLLVTIVVAVVLSPAVQIAYEWERAVMLRFGKFKGLQKPGVFVMVPIMDKVAQYVDQRIRVSDFSAETTLTADMHPQLLAY